MPVPVPIVRLRKPKQPVAGCGTHDLSGFAPVSVSSVCFRSRPNAELHGCSCRCDYLHAWIIPPGAGAGKERLRIGICITRESPPTGWPTGFIVLGFGVTREA